MYLTDYKRYIFILLGASKFAYTLFLFAATTAQTTMNKAIQSMSASVQVKACINSLYSGSQEDFLVMFCVTAFS